MHRIFVYGTLKRGFSNSIHLEGAAFERTAATANGYALHMVSGYPALSRSETGAVHGEVYVVDDEHIGRLDEFEGVPESYRREVIQLEDGSDVEAYVVNREALPGAPRILDGRFLE